MDTKVCIKCGIEKVLEDFTKNSRYKDGRQNTCKACNAKSAKMHIDANPERREYRRIYSSAYDKKYKQAVMDFYGNKCACCEEIESLFLTLDHVNNDGAEHRRLLAGKDKPTGGVAGKVYRDLVRNNFIDKDRFQILCYNCNCGKQRNNGICPHKKVKC